MATTRETVLQALFTRLQTIAGAKVLRNEVFPEKIPSSGLIILRDGDPGEPDVLLSPLSYFWEHRAIIEVAVQAGGQAERDAALDVLFQGISFVIGSDKTLGGLCDLVRPLAPDTDSLITEGIAGIKAAVIPVELIYVTADQLG